MSPLVLASASPRRREWLGHLGLSFEVRVSKFDEPDRPDLSPPELALSHARSKARDVHAHVPTAWVLGADTVVALGGEVFGKPADRVEAEAMLRRLSGRWHEVHTGCCLLAPEGGERTFVETTHVEFRCLGDAEIAEYLEHEMEWVDKAGGYGIQSLAGAFVARIDGSFSNVVGLPLEVLEIHLREVGLLP